MGYKVKTDFWGHKSYYDEKGNLICKEETTRLGDKVIKDQYGNRIGRPVTDEYCRETIELESTSFFGITGPKKNMLREGELEDWEMCTTCGEYFDGEDDEYCESCVPGHH